MTVAGIHISSQIVEDKLPFLLGSVAEVIVGRTSVPKTNWFTAMAIIELNFVTKAMTKYT